MFDSLVLNMRLASSLFISILIFTFYINLTATFVCPPNYCETVNCEDAISCPPGEILRSEGFCGCCKVCNQILKINDFCSNLLQSLRGGPPPIVHCGEGLICKNGTCQNWYN